VRFYYNQRVLFTLPVTLVAVVASPASADKKTSASVKLSTFHPFLIAVDAAVSPVAIATLSHVPAGA